MAARCLRQPVALTWAVASGLAELCNGGSHCQLWPRGQVLKSPWLHFTDAFNTQLWQGRGVDHGGFWGPMSCDTSRPSRRCFVTRETFFTGLDGPCKRNGVRRGDWERAQIPSLALILICLGRAGSARAFSVTLSCCLNFAAVPVAVRGFFLP